MQLQGEDGRHPEPTIRSSAPIAHPRELEAPGGVPFLRSSTCHLRAALRTLSLVTWLTDRVRYGVPAARADAIPALPGGLVATHAAGSAAAAATGTAAASASISTTFTHLCHLLSFRLFLPIARNQRHPNEASPGQAGLRPRPAARKQRGPPHDARLLPGDRRQQALQLAHAIETGGVLSTPSTTPHRATRSASASASSGCSRNSSVVTNATRSKAPSAKGSL